MRLVKGLGLYMFALVAVLRCSGGYAQAERDSIRPNGVYVPDSAKTTAGQRDTLKRSDVRVTADSARKLQRQVKRQDCSLEIVSLKDEGLLKKMEYKKTFTSLKDRERELQRVVWMCYDNAYLLAGYDSLINDSTHLRAYLDFGVQYKWAQLRKGNVDEGVLSEIGFREKLYSNKPLYFKNVKRVEEKLIVYYENHGYPFASVKLDSVVIGEGSISAVLNLVKNDREKIDSVVIRGNAKITNVYMYNYLGVKPGNLYNEAQLKKVNSRLAELPFVRSTKPATITFTDKFNKLILNLEKKRASQFDGIIGILPDNKTGKVLFTGDVQLKLQNGLGRGELIDLNWRRLQTQTQDLKARLVYPFLFRTPFGVDYNFKLYKKDTTYLEVYHNVGVQYLLIGGNYLKIFYSNKTSSLLSTNGYEYVNKLPDYADVSTNMYGLGWKYERLDYRLNPRKGFSILINGSIGEKTIKKNAKLNDSLYKSFNNDFKFTVYSGDFEGSYFIPLFSRTAVKIGGQAAFLYGDNIFANELFRFGGLKTLRGFDEESIYASSYGILSLEYRFILEQNSYLYVFGDQAFYENRAITLPTPVFDHPYGFGAGISFQTKAGIFSISYALGHQFDNPIELRSGKIHFGIINYF